MRAEARQEDDSDLPVTPSLTRPAAVKKFDRRSGADKADEPRGDDDPRVNVEGDHIAETISGVGTRIHVHGDPRPLSEV